MTKFGKLALGIASALMLAGYLNRREIAYAVENAMTDVRSAVNHPNVRKFLSLVRVGEGTADANGYRRIYGGGNFDSFADHPRIKRTMTFKNGKTVTSTAAGAYQFLARTWDEMRAKYDLPDFSPGSQDIAAVGLLKQSGALKHVMDGDFKAAVLKANRIWASLPLSPYGQPTITMAEAGNILGVNLA